MSRYRRSALTALLMTGLYTLLSCGAGGCYRANRNDGAEGNTDTSRSGESELDTTTETDSTAASSSETVTQTTTAIDAGDTDENSDTANDTETTHQTTTGDSTDDRGETDTASARPECGVEMLWRLPLSDGSYYSQIVPIPDSEALMASQGSEVHRLDDGGEVTVLYIPSSSVEDWEERSEPISLYNDKFLILLRDATINREPDILTVYTAFGDEVGTFSSLPNTCRAYEYFLVPSQPWVFAYEYIESAGVFSLCRVAVFDHDGIVLAELGNQPAWTGVSPLAFSGDGLSVYYRTDSGFDIRRMPDLDPMWSVDIDGTLGSLAVSFDGSTIITYIGAEGYIFSDDALIEETFQAQTDIEQVAMSPSGKWAVFTTAESGQIVQDNRPFAAWSESFKSSYGVDISDDGMVLAKYMDSDDCPHVQLRDSSGRLVAYYTAPVNSNRLFSASFADFSDRFCIQTESSLTLYRITALNSECDPFPLPS